MSPFRLSAKSMRQLWTVAVGLFLLCLADMSYAVELVLAQRMGLQADSTIWVIQPHSSRNIPAFCFDRSRPGPTPGNHYSKVLGPGDGATVTRGKKSVPLQVVLGHGLTARGRYLTYREKYGPYNDYEGHGANENTPDGDFTQLVFENQTSGEMKLQVRATTVLGEAADTRQNLILSALAARDPQPQSGHQDNLWDAQNEQLQKMMQALGAYGGETNGDVAARPFQDAMRVFKEKQSIKAEYKPDGEGRPFDEHPFDARTETRLTELSNQAALHELNSKYKQDFITAIVDHSDRRRFNFRVMLGDGVEGRWHYVNNGSEILDLLKKARGEERRKAGKAYVVPGVGLDDRDILALTYSIQHAGGGGVTGRGDFYVQVNEPNNSPLMFDPFFTKKLRNVTDDGKEPRAVQTDSGRAYEKLLQMHFTDDSTAPLELQSQSKSLLRHYVAEIMALAGAPKDLSPQDMPAPQLLVYAEKHTADRTGMSPAQVRALMRAEVHYYTLEPRILPYFAQENAYGLSLATASQPCKRRDGFLYADIAGGLQRTFAEFGKQGVRPVMCGRR